MTSRRLAGYAVLAMSVLAVPFAAATPALAASKATSCKNKSISSDVFLIDAKGISCAKALPVAKKWLAATGRTFGRDDPPNGARHPGRGYRCVYREISSGGAAGVQARTTCTQGKKIIRIGLGSGGSGVGSAGKSCASASYPAELGGYFTSLRVSGGATCTTGKAVQVAYQKCRVAQHGRSGHGLQQEDSGLQVHGVEPSQPAGGAPIQRNRDVHERPQEDRSFLPAESRRLSPAPSASWLPPLLRSAPRAKVHPLQEVPRR